MTSRKRMAQMMDTQREAQDALARHLEKKKEKEVGADMLNKGFSTEDVFAVITKQAMPEFIDKWSKSLATAAENALFNALESPRFERRMNQLIQNQLVQMVNGIMAGVSEILDEPQKEKVEHVIKDNVVSIFKNQPMAKRYIDPEPEATPEMAATVEKVVETVKQTRIQWNKMNDIEKKAVIFERITECMQENNGKLPTSKQFYKYYQSGYMQALKLFDNNWSNVIEAYMKSI